MLSQQENPERNLIQTDCTAETVSLQQAFIERKKDFIEKSKSRLSNLKQNAQKRENVSSKHSVGSQRNHRHAKKSTAKSKKENLNPGESSNDADRRTKAAREGKPRIDYILKCLLF